MLDLLSESQNNKLQKLATVANILNICWLWYGKIEDIYETKTKYTITLESQDDAYLIVLKELSKLLPIQQQKHTKVHYSGNSTDSHKIFGTRKKNTENVQFVYNAQATQIVEIHGQKIKLTLDTLGPDDLKNIANVKLPEKITFTAKNHKALSAVKEFIRDTINNRSQQLPGLWLSTSYGDWNFKKDIPPRRIETVVLKTGQVERLIKDIQNFKEKESYYNDLGIPYHRGYLFEGPSGTGKSSVAKALANHFGMNIYYGSLADIDKDTSIIELFSGVKKDSILLLEDIDTLSATTPRTDEETSLNDPGTVSLSGLLNALDGITTPHGLITILTTNHLKNLDDAILRSGRIDLIEHIGYIDQNQFERLLRLRWPAMKGIPTLVSKTVAPCDVIEIIKRNFDDPAAAMIALGDKIA